MAGKSGSRRYSTTCFSESVVVAYPASRVQTLVAGYSGGNKLSNVRSFSILQSREVLTSFNNDNSANVSGEKKYNHMKNSGVSIF